MNFDVDGSDDDDMMDGEQMLSEDGGDVSCLKINILFKVVFSINLILLLRSLFVLVHNEKFLLVVNGRKRKISN